MERLEALRTEIDRIDRELLALYEARMDVCGAVAAYKRENSLPILQPEREQAVLDRVESRVSNPNYAPGAKALFEALMAASRALQASMINETANAPAPAAPPALVAYPGAPGAFSEQAARAFFGDGVPTRAYPRFDEVAQALSRGDVDAAVLPLENSTAGSVDESIALIVKYGLAIAGECVIAIRQHLLGLPGGALAGVREIRSHPQALAQCHAFLLDRPDVRVVPCENTALAARSVADDNDPSIAAIASEAAAKAYGLDVLAEGIQDARRNQTRFVLLTRTHVDAQGADKASVHFVLDDRVGALKQVVDAFARRDINMTHLSSRPLNDSPWTYAFYADLDWTGGRAALDQALDDARAATRDLILLGLYRGAKGVHAL